MIHGASSPVPPSGTAAGGAASAPTGEAFDEQEQRALDMVVNRAADHVHAEANARKLIDMVQNSPSGDPVEALGTMAAQFVAGLDEELDLPETVILHAGIEVMELMAEVVDAAGVADFSANEQETERAAQYTIAALSDIYEQTSDDVAEGLGAEGMQLIAGKAGMSPAPPNEGGAMIPPPAPGATGGQPTMTDYRAMRSG